MKSEWRAGSPGRVCTMTKCKKFEPEVCKRISGSSVPPYTYMPWTAQNLMEKNMIMPSICQVLKPKYNGCTRSIHFKG